MRNIQSFLAFFSEGRGAIPILPIASLPGMAAILRYSIIIRADVKAYHFDEAALRYFIYGSLRQRDCRITCSLMQEKLEFVWV
jgi:hypothetical protein